VRQAYIKQSVILNYQVCHGQNRWMLQPHTLPAAAGQCYSYIIVLRPHMPSHDDTSQWANGKFNPLPRPNLSNGRPPPPIGQTIRAIRDEHGVMCVGGGGTNRRTCGRARLPPVLDFSTSIRGFRQKKLVVNDMVLLSVVVGESRFVLFC